MLQPLISRTALPYEDVYPLIDTHTHFDDPVFDADRSVQLALAQQAGIRHLLLIGYLQRYFERIFEVKNQINQHATASGLHKVAPPTNTNSTPAHEYIQAHIALGLHPFYIQQHSENDLHKLHDSVSQRSDVIAIGEIGLDTFTATMKLPQIYAQQQRFFEAQLDIAIEHRLPVLLHIRKAHADCLRILKNHAYDATKLGGIAHSFSGGVQEAKAFVALGFKLGVTGQVTNPNAKKLRRAIVAAVAEYGISCLVIETDCPDMLPLTAQYDDTSPPQAMSLSTPPSTSKRNTPANLVYVLATLSELLSMPADQLAKQLWKNSCDALRVDWQYP